MRIFITGADGQLGTELQDILGKGYSEIGKISNQYKDAEIMLIDKPQLDLTDFEELQKTLNKFNPDIIINCAALTNVDGCEVMQELAYKLNSMLPEQLALYAKEANCKLVQVSTDYVFKGDKKEPYVEQDACEPQSVYGESKFLGEKHAMQHQKTFIVRTAWLYGYNGKNFVKTIMRLSKSGNQLKVVNDQFGNPTNANDLAYHILKLALTEEYGIYHCTNNGTCSWYEFACEFLKLANISNLPQPCTTEEFYAGKESKSANRPMFSSLDNMALRNAAKDEMRTWQEAIAMYIKNGIERGIFE